MYAQADGIGFAWIPLLVAAVSAGGSVAAARLARPGQPTPAQIETTRRAEEEKARQRTMYFIAGGIGLVFLMMAMRR